METQFSLINRAHGRVDADMEGQDMRANAIVLQKPAGAPFAYEVLYAPVYFEEGAGSGIFQFHTPHGLGKLRQTTLYGGTRLELAPDTAYMVLMGASGRTARIDRA